MNYFIDIKLLPDPEFRATVLLNSVYTKLHKTLCDLKSHTIGVSFPAYQVTLGNILRIHGKLNDLKALQQNNWLGGMIGYCKVSEISPVPDGVKHRTVWRKQSTMSEAKLRRLIKRGSISEEAANQYRVNMFTKDLDNPYLELVSGSNGHRHRRYIEFGELMNTPVAGQYDQFGLSAHATIPWF